MLACGLGFCCRQLLLTVHVVCDYLHFLGFYFIFLFDEDIIQCQLA